MKERNKSHFQTEGKYFFDEIMMIYYTKDFKNGT